MSNTGFFAGLEQDAGTSSLGSDVIPQSMRFGDRKRSQSGTTLVVVKDGKLTGFPPPSGFSGPSPERRMRT